MVLVLITPRSFPSSWAKISWIVLLQFFTWSIRLKNISLQILQEIAILNIPREISANCIEPGTYMMWRSLRDGIFSVTVFLLYKLSSKWKKCQIDVLFLGVLTNRTWWKECHSSLKLRAWSSRCSSQFSLICVFFLLISVLKCHYLQNEWTKSKTVKELFS